MTEEEYIRMKNLLNAVIEQQATFAERQAQTDAKAAERQAKTDEQIAHNTEGIAALLVIAQMHDEEITRTNKEVAERFKETAERFKETEDRINALVDVVERYISKS